MSHPHPTPHQVVQRLVAALNSGDLTAAVSCYAPDAVFIPQPGSVVSGQAAIREALTQMLTCQPTLTTHAQVVFESADTALFCSKWSMTGTAPDGSAVNQTGSSSDVLRRQPDASWLIAIDNPFGPEVIAAP